MQTTIHTCMYLVCTQYTACRRLHKPPLVGATQHAYIGSRLVSVPDTERTGRKSLKRGPAAKLLDTNQGTGMHVDAFEGSHRGLIQRARSCLNNRAHVAIYVHVGTYPKPINPGTGLGGIPSPICHLLIYPSVHLHPYPEAVLYRYGKL